MYRTLIGFSANILSPELNERNVIKKAVNEIALLHNLIARKFPKFFYFQFLSVFCNVVLINVFDFLRTSYPRQVADYEHISLSLTLVVSLPSQAEPFSREVYRFLMSFIINFPERFDDALLLADTFCDVETRDVIGSLRLEKMNSL